MLSGRSLSRAARMATRAVVQLDDSAVILEILGTTRRWWSLPRRGCFRGPVGYLLSMINRSLSSMLASCLFGAAAMAGPLTPPAGPVAPTGKTTQEVFDKVAAAEPRIAINATNTPGDNDGTPSLFKITQSGSYYLTGNITGVSGSIGIEIVTSGVTVDLNGFDVVGVPGSLDGISITTSIPTNVSIINGSVRNWGGDGVDVGSNGANNCRVADVVSSFNAFNGIRIGPGGTVTNCLAHQNTLTGIVTSFGATVTKSIARNNGSNGISLGFGSTISACAAYNNTLNGIAASTGCTITDCSAMNNDAAGISTADGCTVSNCTIVGNLGDGISASIGCVVTGCVVRNNTLNGIVVAGQSIVSGNLCSSNGFGTGSGAGIRATSSGNRIEDNNCVGADRGIEVANAGNIIIRNTCSNNSFNWVIAADNIYGPIVDRRIPSPVTSTPAVSGSTAAGTLGSSEPNANFSY